MRLWIGSRCVQERRWRDRLDGYRSGRLLPFRCGDRSTNYEHGLCRELVRRWCIQEHRFGNKLERCDLGATERTLWSQCWCPGDWSAKSQHVIRGHRFRRGLQEYGWGSKLGTGELGTADDSFWILCC